jgi:hypothetical protein
MQFKLTSEFLDTLKESINTKDSARPYDLIKDLHPADIAKI